NAVGQPYALQVAQDLSGVNHTLSRIRKILIGIAAGGIALAAALGLLVSRAALAPVRRLTAATDKVRETGDLRELTGTYGSDEELGEMTTLIAGLIELARAEQRPEEPEDVRLDLVATDAVERTRRNRPGVTFETDLEESIVHGVPTTIERAVANLLDNAAKWSPPGGRVEVEVRDATLTVRDQI